MQNRAGDDFRRVDGRRKHRSTGQVVLGVVHELGVGRRGAYQSHRYWRARLLQLDAQHIGHRLDRMLAGAVAAVEGQGIGRLDTADVDQRTAFITQMLHRDGRAVVRAPEVGLHDLLVVFVADLVEAAPDRAAGIVDPGIKATEARDRLAGDAFQLRTLAHVGHDVKDAIPRIKLSLDFEQRFFVARHQHHACALFDGEAGRGQADTARSAGNDDDLLMQGFERNAHRVSSNSGDGVGSVEAAAPLPVPDRRWMAALVGLEAGRRCGG